MVPEDKLDDFVRRFREAAGSNLECVILYGSAVSGDFQPEFSNLNLFCLLRDSSLAALRPLASVVKWWDGKKQPGPLLMTRNELECSSDVFAIELMDMQQHHRVLFGEDPLQDLKISTHHHRIQVEYELREKLILLRQQLLLSSGSNRQSWNLLLHSVPSFVTLFRHSLIALGQPALQAGKRETVQALSKQVGFDPSAINQVLDVRERKISAGKIDIEDLCARYLAAIEQVTASVDKAMDTDLPGRS